MKNQQEEASSGRVRAQAIELTWNKSPRGDWYRLFDIDLDAVQGHGVYVIWHGGFPGRTVKIAHGEIADHLSACRRDERVGAFAEFGPVFVTWALADAAGARGMVRHLADRLCPLIEESGEDAQRIPANSPF